MKKLAFMLIICMFLTTLTGCFSNNGEEGITSETTGDSEILSSEELDKILESMAGNNKAAPFDKPIKLPSKSIDSILKSSSKSNILALAKEYYDMAFTNIEPNTRSEYSRLVTWNPDFKEKKSISESDKMLAKKSSINSAMALSYTNAKNFYISMAAAVFSLNPDDMNSAGNLAAAVAAYGDDLALAGTGAGNLKKYYEDAIKIYNYSLIAAAKSGKYNETSLPHMVSLGNLYFDNGKSDEAYICFKTAYEINDEYWPAIEGLYNFYMAKQQFKKALDLVADTAKYPGFIKTTAKASEQQKEASTAGGTSQGAAAEPVLEKKMDALAANETISTADFLDEIDLEAKQKLKSLIKQVEGRLNFKAPDITLISQYASLKSVSEPLGESALMAFETGVFEYEARADFLNTKVNIRLLGKMGIKTDLGGYKNLEELEAAMDRLGGEDSFTLEMNETEGESSDEYWEDLEASADSLLNGGDTSEYYKNMAKGSPEYSIFLANPYDYANPVDILVQRYNVLEFNTKWLTYGGYMGTVNGRVGTELAEIKDKCSEKVDELEEEQSEKHADVMDKYEGFDDDDEYLRMLKEYHAVCNNYRPKLNNIKEVSWNQATQLAVTAFKQKIKKYAEQMYNDCMKNIILISDDNIRQYMEEKLYSQLFIGLSTAYRNVYDAYSFVTYEDPHDCGCNLEGLAEAAEEEQKEREKLEKQQEAKNKEAKQRFENGEIDENSEYYKKIIKPYETKLKTPFFEGVVGPYKTGWTAKLDIPDVAGIEFGKMTQNIRNTTTYSGGVEFGPDVEFGSSKAGIKAFLQFSATKGANGQFAVDDVDVMGGGKITLSTTTTASEAGITASALRGTKAHASFSVTGDNLLNDDLKTAMGNWKPNLSKTLFKGEYPIVEGK